MEGGNGNEGGHEDVPGPIPEFPWPVGVGVGVVDVDEDEDEDRAGVWVLGSDSRV